MFNNVYADKEILVTGHTGFKGSWLVTWLLKLNAKVIGISLNPPSEPSLFEVANLSEKIVDCREDIRNFKNIKSIVQDVKPDYIFHLAAQPIVKTSFEDPISTFNTNIIGTANILEAARELKKTCNLILITSDKCYSNNEWNWGYREIDILGGKDPYSASKACAELVISSMHNSFFEKGNSIRIASTRAGNVIGGGDWASNRIIPDAIKAWSKGKKVSIRNPQSTRPWQHVLEPISGYLRLGQLLKTNKKLSGESYNFGPKTDQVKTVLELLKNLGISWGYNNEDEMLDIYENNDFKEAGLLKLNCDKAMHDLNWYPILDFDQTINMTSSWYKNFYKTKNRDVFEFTDNQITDYTKLAINKKIPWTK